jgi:hypothetical protein
MAVNVVSVCMSAAQALVNSSLELGWIKKPQLSQVAGLMSAELIEHAERTGRFSAIQQIAAQNAVQEENERRHRLQQLQGAPLNAMPRRAN